MATPCECATAGWCPRHRCHKTQHFLKLCQERADFFAAWEAGKGPCIQGTPEDGVPIATPRKSRGLGDVLAKALAVVGIHKKPGCRCGARQSSLNTLVPFGQDSAPNAEPATATPGSAPINGAN